MIQNKSTNGEQLSQCTNSTKDHTSGSNVSQLHCVSKKVPTFRLSVTLSNLNRFSNFRIAEKLVKIATKTRQLTQLTLGMMLHYLGMSKIQTFCKY